MLAPDYVSHSRLVAGQPPGREGEKWAISQLNTALSNRSIHFEDQIAAGHKVASRFVVHVTPDRGELMGVAPTGKVMTNKTIMIHRISEGKIAEEWSIGTLGLKLRAVRLEQEVRERERVDQELRVARRIQQASLPKTVPTLEGWRISPFYQPGRWEETSTTSTSSLRAESGLDHLRRVSRGQDDLPSLPRAPRRSGSRL
jgi:hypothetical protein